MSKDKSGNDAALELHRGNSVNREHWRNVCAMILSRQPMEALCAMEAAGYDEFHRIAKSQYRGHGFNDDDYRYVYAVVCRCAKNRERVDPRTILGSGNPNRRSTNRILDAQGNPVRVIH